MEFNIANMNQTMSRFDMLSNRTNNVKGELNIDCNNIWIMSCTKRGFTVALCGKGL